MLSNPLDVVAAIEAVRSNQDGQDQHRRVDEIAARSTQQRIEKTGRHALDNAEQHTGEQRASNAVQPAENGDRYALKQQLRKRLVYTLHRSEERRVGKECRSRW